MSKSKKASLLTDAQLLEQIESLTALYDRRTNDTVVEQTPEPEDEENCSDDVVPKENGRTPDQPPHRLHVNGKYVPATDRKARGNFAPPLRRRASSETRQSASNRPTRQEREKKEDPPAKKMCFPKQEPPPMRRRTSSLSVLIEESPPATPVKPKKESLELERARVKHQAAKELKALKRNSPAIVQNKVDPFLFAQQYFFHSDGTVKDLTNYQEFQHLFTKDSYIDPGLYLQQDSVEKLGTVTAVQSLMARCQTTMSWKKCTRLVESAKKIAHEARRDFKAEDGQLFQVFDKERVVDHSELNLTHPLRDEELSLFEVSSKVHIDNADDVQSMCRQVVNEYMYQLFSPYEAIKITGSYQSTAGYFFVGTEMVPALLRIISLAYGVKLSESTRVQLRVHLQYYLKRYFEHARVKHAPVMKASNRNNKKRDENKEREKASLKNVTNNCRDSDQSDPGTDQQKDPNQ